MATYNHTIQVTNGNTTDVYHPETNSAQVYDFNNQKWMNEMIGTLSTLTTSQKQNLVLSINSLKTEMDNKQAIEVVDSVPSGKAGVFFHVQNGVGNTPSKPSGSDGIDPQVVIDLIDGISVNAKTKGAVANNETIDNKPVLQELFSATNIDTVTIPSGTYNSTRIAVGIKNKVIKGVPDKTILQTTGSELLFLQDSENVVFEDIVFSAISNSTSNGVVTANGSSLKNITFRRCKFTTNGSNGVKFINEGDKTSEFINFENCTFENIGRMGVEFQNHNDTARVYRYSNVVFSQCIFKNLGLVEHGMGISMSGVGKWVTVQNCTFVDCASIGVEMIGTNYVTIDNCEFVGETKSYTPIGITNDRPNDYITVTNNKSSGSLGQVNFYNGTNLLFANNQFYGIDKVYVKNFNNSKFTNNIITARGGEAMFFDNAHHNEIWGNTLDTRISTGNLTVCKFYGSASTNNKFYNNQLYRANGGLWVASTDGATNNELGTNYYENATMTGYETPLRVNETFLNKWPTSGVTSVTVTLVQGASWQPFDLEITCYGVENGGGNLFHTVTRVFGKHHGSLEYEKRDITTPYNAAITLSKSGTTLTFTCTHSNAEAAGVHNWSIKGTSYYSTMTIA